MASSQAPTARPAAFVDGIPLYTRGRPVHPNSWEQSFYTPEELQARSAQLQWEEKSEIGKDYDGVKFSWHEAPNDDKEPVADDDGSETDFRGFDGSEPRQSAPPAAPAHDDDNEAAIAFVPTVRTGAEHPKARIQQRLSGDNSLMRYYLRHGTFNGAQVFIEPNVCYNAAYYREQYYRVEEHYPEDPIAQIEHGGGEDELLKQYYLEHYTFAGAMVYVKPDMDSEQE